MKTAIAHLVGSSPYSQSRPYSEEVPELSKESKDDYERRTWRHRMHTDASGHVVIPGQCPGKGSTMALAEEVPRLPKGAVQSYESKTERQTSRKRGLRLTEAEIAELQDYWLGYAAEIGFRSVHGSLEARGLRRPPSTWAKRHVLEYLERAGGRCPEAKFIRDFVEGAKNTLEIGIQRHEASEAVKELIAAGVLEKQRVQKPNGDESFMELRLVERGEVQPRTALRSVHSSLREVRMTAKERAWAAKDRELWLMWNEVPVHDESGSNWMATSQVEHGLGGGHMGRSIASALDAMSDEGAAVLQAAYGTPPSAFAGAYGEGLGHVAAMTPAVRKAREDLASDAALAAAKRVQGYVEVVASGARSVVDVVLYLHPFELRRIRPEDILRDRASDDVFRKRVAAEAEAMLVRACAEYRKARLRG